MSTGAHFVWLKSIDLKISISDWVGGGIFNDFECALQKRAWKICELRDGIRFPRLLTLLQQFLNTLTAVTVNSATICK
jgi:hypothetical protein